MYDKVTKIDAIAKRKAWTKTNTGVLTEHAGSSKAAADNGRAFSDFKATRGDYAPKLRNGKLRRPQTSIGSGYLITNFARGTSARPR